MVSWRGTGDVGCGLGLGAKRWIGVCGMKLDGGRGMGSEKEGKGRLTMA